MLVRSPGVSSNGGLGRSRYFSFYLATVIVLFSGYQVLGQADINNGTVRLGVNKGGALITPAINAPIVTGVGFGSDLGLRFMPTNYECVALGVYAEGWGVADVTTGTWGGCDNGGAFSFVAAGAMVVNSFTSTANSCTSVVTLSRGGLPVFQVTHAYAPSVSPNIFTVVTTIQNVSAAPVVGRYRRILDWDVQPTATNEFVTIQGATLPGVISFTDNALGSVVNPLIPAAGVNGDVVNKGPGDLGATVTIDLGTLPPGGQFVLPFFYGAAADRATAVAQITLLGIPGYSLAQPSSSPANVGTPNTFLWGFYGGSGAVIPPNPGQLPGGPPTVGPAAPGTEGWYKNGGGQPGTEGSFGYGGRSALANGDAFFLSRITPSLLGPIPAVSETHAVVHRAPSADAEPALADSSPASDAVALAIAGLALAGAGILTARAFR